MSARPGVAQASHRIGRTRPDLGWQERAACVDANPRIFFDPERFGEALAVCRSCPVKRPCRQSRHVSDEGVWGGRVYRKRKALA